MGRVETGQRQERPRAGHVPEAAEPAEEKGHQMVVEVSSAWEGVLAPLKAALWNSSADRKPDAGLKGCAVTPPGHPGRLSDPCSFPRPPLSHLLGPSDVRLSAQAVVGWEPLVCTLLWEQAH